MRERAGNRSPKEKNKTRKQNKHSRTSKGRKEGGDSNKPPPAVKSVHIKSPLKWSNTLCVKTIQLLFVLFSCSSCPPFLPSSPFPSMFALTKLSLLSRSFPAASGASFAHVRSGLLSAHHISQTRGTNERRRSKCGEFQTKVTC